MPALRDWVALWRETGSSLDRDKVRDLYLRDWPGTREKLISEHREEIEREKSRLKRFLRTANAVSFGLTKRLAPPRRLLLGVAGVLVALSFLQGAYYSHGGGKEGGWTISINYNGATLFLAIVLLLALLGMELVDKIRFRDELELARDLQADLIPRVLPEPPGYALAAHNRIANTVGGDIYDFVPLPDGRLAVLFGDASGHGMTAGLVMAVAHAAFRTQLDVDARPESIFASLNRILCRTGGPRSFFACIYVVAGPDGSFCAMVAGHPPALLLDREGNVRRRIGRGAYPLGIKPSLEWPPEGETLAPGETLLIYSDGLPEARNAAEEEFGEERIAAAARRLAGRPPGELVTALAWEVDAFCGRQAPEDDVSIAAIRRREPPDR
jgi:serine phosphatase RsbU (regulator of sigma subunit)